MEKLKQEQFLPITLDQAWKFFATPKNLNEITPDNMVFQIISSLPETMYEGMFINYRLKPMLNISIAWCTEITHIKEKEYFVDEQRIGPYRIWHHEHHFKAVEDGVIMTDILHYDIGKWFIRQIVGKLFVNKKVKSIFAYRFKLLASYFQTSEIINS